MSPALSANTVVRSRHSAIQLAEVLNGRSRTRGAVEHGRGYSGTLTTGRSGFSEFLMMVR
jgi:hypothetical protein